VRLQSGQVLSLGELDALLDVPTTAFDRHIARLARAFVTKGARVAIPSGRDRLADQKLDTKVSWARLYEAQIRRLPPMDRSEEFLMARRYEFMRARAAAALRAAGYPKAQLDDLVRSTFADLPPLPRAARGERLATLRRAMRELEALRNRYVEGALYLVLACCQRYRNLGVDFVDLVQEGNASLFQAIEGFDWRRDVRFKTYAQYWIHQAILKVLYNSSRTVRVPIWVQKALRKIQRVREAERPADGSEVPTSVIAERVDMTAERVEELLRTKRHAVSLDIEVTEEGASLGSMVADERPVEMTAVDDEQLADRLREVMADLPERERRILERRYGLTGSEPETLGAIADDLGITAERVRQLQKAALARLRRPKKINRLQAYV
jgi:RNA polymerase sigma factor (sigma-70 family)